MRDMEVRRRCGWSNLNRWRWNRHDCRLSTVGRLPWCLLELDSSVAESFLRRPNLGLCPCAHLGLDRIRASIASSPQRLHSRACCCVCLDARALQRSLCLRGCPMLGQFEPSLGENLLPMKYVSNPMLPRDAAAFCDRCNPAFQMLHLAHLALPLLGLHAGAVRAGHLHREVAHRLHLRLLLLRRLWWVRFDKVAWALWDLELE